MNLPHVVYYVCVSTNERQIAIQERKSKNKKKQIYLMLYCNETTATTASPSKMETGHKSLEQMQRYDMCIEYIACVFILLRMQIHF